MNENASDSGIKTPALIWELLEQYLTLSEKYDERTRVIEEHANQRLIRYFQEKSPELKHHLVDTNALIGYIDEYVDNLLIYYAYYRSVRRSMETLFASIGITDHRMFAEMVRASSDPRVKIQINDLDQKGVDWFLRQFLDEFQAVERNIKRLADYLPKLMEAVEQTYSESMQRFCDVLQYATSDESIQLRLDGYAKVETALANEDLNKKVNHIVEAVEFFVTDAQNHPAFILTESAGYFGTAELEEFDQKITSFKAVHELFKEHVSLSNRTRWIYERHHTTLFSSIFEGSHLELLEMRDRIRQGASLKTYESHIRDCQGMLLGVSQAYSLFLEYSAYSQQMLTLVDAYREIANFLQSELVQILYTMELQRNHLYLEVRDDFQQTLDKFQQTLLEVCSLNPTEN
ncbi:MAG: hypothetical protein ACFE9D_12360 [Promethearchaeota archaeon]